MFRFGIELCALSLLLSLPLGAWAQGTPTRASDGASPLQTQIAAVPTPNLDEDVAPAADLGAGERDFLKTAAESGQMEIAGSRLALQKSGSADVKAFAQEMLDAHRALGERLKALASRKKLEIATEPTLVQKGELKILEMRDEGFDQAYVDQIGVSAHESAVKLFEQAAQDVQDPEVRAFAGKTLPTLQEHLQMARDLQATVQARQQ